MRQGNKKRDSPPQAFINKQTVTHRQLFFALENDAKLRPEPFLKKKINQMASEFSPEFWSKKQMASAIEKILFDSNGFKIKCRKQIF